MYSKENSWSRDVEDIERMKKIYCSVYCPESFKVFLRSRLERICNRYSCLSFDKELKVWNKALQEKMESV